MAISPKNVYPATQIDGTDPNYPHGKAKNISALGNKDGTPWEKQHVSDLWGFLQAILHKTGQTPTGTPDNVSASQYLDGILGLAAGTVEALTSPGTTTLVIPSWFGYGNRIEATLVGGGGGGGGATSMDPSVTSSPAGAGWFAGGGGGGSGDVQQFVIPGDPALAGTTVDITVGAGGAGGAAVQYATGSENDGVDGSDTTLTINAQSQLLSAIGGDGGNGGARYAFSNQMLSGGGGGGHCGGGGAISNVPGGTPTTNDLIGIGGKLRGTRILSGFEGSDGVFTSYSHQQAGTYTGARGGMGGGLPGVVSGVGAFLPTLRDRYDYFDSFSSEYSFGGKFKEVLLITGANFNIGAAGGGGGAPGAPVLWLPAGVAQVGTGNDGDGSTDGEGGRGGRGPGAGGGGAGCGAPGVPTGVDYSKAGGAGAHGYAYVRIL